MGLQLGEGTFVGIGREASYGTAVKAQALLRYISGQPSPQVATIESQNLSVSSGMLDDIKKGTWQQAGNMAFEVQPEGGFLVALLALLGGYSKTGVGPYTHTFTTSGTPDPVTLVMTQEQEEQYGYLYPGGYVSGLEINASNKDEILTASFPVVAQKIRIYDEAKGGASWANLFASYALSTSPVFTGLHLGVSLDGGTTLSTDVEGCSLSVSRPARQRQPLNRSMFGVGYGFGRQAVSGGLQVAFSTMAEWKQFFGLASGAAFTLEPTTAIGEYPLQYDWLGELISGSNYYRFKVDLPKAEVIALDAPMATPDYIVQSLGWRAKRDTVSGTDIKVTVVNNDACTYLGSTGTAVTVY